MSYFNNTIRIDANVDVNIELEKGDILSEFEADELLLAVRESWSDQEILDELDHEEVEAWLDNQNKPLWAIESVYNAHSDEQKKAFGIPRRLKF